MIFFIVADDSVLASAEAEASPSIMFIQEVASAPPTFPFGFNAKPRGQTVPLIPLKSYWTETHAWTFIPCHIYLVAIEGRHSITSARKNLAVGWRTIPETGSVLFAKRGSVGISGLTGINYVADQPYLLNSIRTELSSGSTITVPCRGVQPLCRKKKACAPEHQQAQTVMSVVRGIAATDFHFLDGVGADIQGFE